MDQIHTSASQLSAIVPEVWSQQWYDVLLAELPFNAVVARQYEGEIKALGNTVHINSIPEFGDAEDLAEDGAADADSVTISQVDLVINKQIVKDFIVTDKALLQSLPFMDKLRDLAVYAVNKKVQRYIIEASIPSASGPDHSIAYDSSTTLALADMTEVKELLDNQDVPALGRHCVLGSPQTNDIFNITGFTSRDFLLAGSPLQSGLIPDQLLGFKPHMTTEVGNTSYWFHESFFTMAAQKNLEINQYDLGVTGKRAQRVNVTTLAGFKLLDSLRLVTLG